MAKWIRGAALLAALVAALPALAQGTAAGAASPPPKTALQLMLQKGVITQAEYDAAVAGNTEVVKEVRETVVVQATPRIDAPPVTSKWNATMYGFIEADYIYDSTQSFADLAGNVVRFLDDAVDRWTIDAAGVQSAHLEGPLESVDVSLRLPQMRLEAHL